eukprot:3624263-Amphidinium_carterae.1
MLACALRPMQDRVLNCALVCQLMGFAVQEYTSELQKTTSCRVRRPSFFRPGKTVSGKVTAVSETLRKNVLDDVLVVDVGVDEVDVAELVVLIVVLDVLEVELVVLDVELEDDVLVVETVVLDVLVVLLVVLDVLELEEVEVEVDVVDCVLVVDDVVLDVLDVLLVLDFVE